MSSNGSISARPLGEILAGGAACAAACTSSWSGVRFFSVNVSDLIAIAAIILAALFAWGRSVELNRIPGWSFVFPVGAVVLVLLHLLFPLRDAVDMSIGPIPFAARAVLATLVPLLVVVPLVAANRSWAKVLVTASLLGILVNCFVSILQARDALPGWIQVEGVIGTTSNRFPGLSSHPNGLAQAAALGIPFALLMLGSRLRFLGLVGFGLTSSALIWAVIISGSRAGLIVAGAMLIGCAFAYFTSARRWELAPFALLGVLVVAVRKGPEWIAGTRLSGGVTAGDSDLGRLDSFDRGWDLFVQSPVFGFGPGAWFGELSPLVLLVAGGVPLLLLYVVFLLKLVRVLWCARNSSRVVRAGGLALLGFVLFAILNNGIFERPIYWLLYVALALALADSRRNIALPGNRRDAVA